MKRGQMGADPGEDDLGGERVGLLSPDMVVENTTRPAAPIETSALVRSPAMRCRHLPFDADDEGRRETDGDIARVHGGPPPFQGSDGRPRQLHLSRRLARVGRTGSIARSGNGPETIGIEARSADECAVDLGEIEDGCSVLRIDRAAVEDPRAPRQTRANGGVHC